MIEIDKIFLFLIVALLLLVIATNVRAASPLGDSATLPIKAKIIRCVTIEERHNPDCPNHIPQEEEE